MQLQRFDQSWPDVHRAKAFALRLRRGEPVTAALTVDPYHVVGELQITDADGDSL
jgi:hypothetical protein